MHSRSPVLYALAATAGLALAGPLVFPGCAGEVVGPPLVECDLDGGLFPRNYCPPDFGCAFVNCQGFGPDPAPAGPFAHDPRPCYCRPLADAEGCCQKGLVVAVLPVDPRIPDGPTQPLCLTPAFAGIVCTRIPCTSRCADAGATSP